MHAGAPKQFGLLEEDEGSVEGVQLLEHRGPGKTPKTSVVVQLVVGAVALEAGPAVLHGLPEQVRDECVPGEGREEGSDECTGQVNAGGQIIGE